MHWFCLGDSRVAQVNNSPRANVFPAGEARKVTPGLPQDTPDGFDLYSAQSSFAWPRVDFGLCWIRFSSWESFIGFYIWCYPISTILACLFTVEVRISGKKLCWKGPSRVAEMSSRASYLVYYIVWRVNLSKLSRKLVWAFRTTTTNCRVSFIDLYEVFPTNFRIVFLPNTNTVILLEPYCGNITQHGLPVDERTKWTAQFDLV